MAARDGMVAVGWAVGGAAAVDEVVRREVDESHDAAATVAAHMGRCPLCARAVAMFLEALGAEAANVALRYQVSRQQAAAPLRRHGGKKMWLHL